MWRGVPEFWTSRVISPALIDAARGDRTLWADLGTQISGFDSNAMMGARAWGEASRIAMLYRGTGSIGLPASAIVTIAEGLGPLIMDPPDDIRVLMEQLARMSIGLAVDMLAAIPIVGNIASAIGSVALFLWDVLGKEQPEAQEFLPPPQAYDRDAEEFVMNTQLVPTLSTSDWTRLFMPRMGTNPRIEEIDTGWLMKSDARGKGLGFIPGTQQITSSIHALWHQKSSRAGGSSAVHQDIGDFFPSPAQLMTAIDQQVQRPGPELWSVVPSEIRASWREYQGAVMEFAYEMYFGRGIGGTGLDKLNEEQRRIIVQQLVAPLHVSRVGDEIVRGAFAANSWSPKNPPDDIVETFVEPWCARMEERQDYYLGTTAVAYADPQSAAFERSGKLRDKLKRMQALLLQSPARYEVDQRDVLDPEFRAALHKATTGGDLKAAGDGDVLRTQPRRIGSGGRGPRPPTKPQGGAPFQLVTPKERSGAGGLAIAIGLAALGAVWSRRHQR